MFIVKKKCALRISAMNKSWVMIMRISFELGRIIIGSRLDVLFWVLRIESKQHGSTVLRPILRAREALHSQGNWRQLSGLSRPR